MHEPALQQVLADFGTIQSITGVGGGCISEASRVELVQADGQSLTLFVKSNHSSFLENFECEADGLRELLQTDSIQVPRVRRIAGIDEHVFLVTDWIEQSRRSSDFFEIFARRLAALHQTTMGDQIGWHRDNYLGSARQINSPDSESWISFFSEYRIGFQVRWAVDQELCDKRLKRDCERIITSLADLLSGRDDATSLLHGDLWSGNYLADGHGNPVIIDPAVYRGCREAEFGMLKLFGSCPEAFYNAYQDHLPMPSGWQRRVSVYVLYHLLNHLNLFGSGYLSQCHSMAAQILSQ